VGSVAGTNPVMASIFDQSSQIIKSAEHSDPLSAALLATNGIGAQLGGQEGQKIQQNTQTLSTLVNALNGRSVDQALAIAKPLA